MSSYKSPKRELSPGEVIARHNVRCYPTPAQIVQLEREFEATRVVYNLCLEMARHAHRCGEKYPGKAGLKKAITGWKQRSDWEVARQASVQCLQWAAIYAHQAFKNFFRRVKKGEAPGYPRPKRPGRIAASATYNIVHCHWQNGVLRLAKQSSSHKLNWDGRGLPVDPRSVTIRRDACGRYFASFTCVCDTSERFGGVLKTGLDLGVTNTVASTTVDEQGNEQSGLMSQPVLLSPGRQRRYVRLQRKLARQQKGSNSRGRTKKAIARLAARMADGRKTWQDRVSREIVDSSAFIAVEDLKIAAMVRRPAPRPNEAGDRFMPNGARAKAGLNRALQRSALSGLRSKIEYKAKWAGVPVVAVNPAYTSRTCAMCGYEAKGNRPTQATFVCGRCGHEAHADINAARNILALAKTVARSKAVGGDPAELMRVEGAKSAPVEARISVPKSKRHNASGPGG